MAIAALDLDGLRSRLDGIVIGPFDPNYDEARRVWNGAIDRRPAAIARCASPADVAAALRYAVDAGLEVAVRGGGHSIPGFSTCDGGLVIDLAELSEVTVDPDARTATVGGGATWAAYDAATHAHGLASTGGLISHTGVAGLTLGGGIGWLVRKCGLACDNLLSIEVVTAAGDLVHASAAEHPDLFWGVRGGGGNFGVVIAFEFALHPVSTVYGGLLLFPAARTREVLGRWRDSVAAAPDELSTIALLVTAPPAPFIPQEIRGQPALALGICHCGDPAEAESLVASFRGLGPAADLVGSMPYPALQQLADPGAVWGTRAYFKSGFTEAADEVLDVFVEHAAARPGPQCEVHVHHLGGAMRRVPAGDTSFANREASFCFNVVAMWQDPGDLDTHRAWARDLVAAAEPYRSGEAPVNFMGDAEGPDALARSYGAERFARLQGLKRVWDPGNVFHLNQNIVP